MAITKVYAVRHNLHHAVDYAANEDKTSLDKIISYAANPEKTERRLFESVINCSSVENAYREMTETKKKFGKTGNVLAYHYIQSFAPDEATPELAHKIGVELARECFGDRFEVVIGTHLDRKHLHNHIVVNSVSFVDGGKLRSTPESYYSIIRKTSDRLCVENALSVIANPQNRGMHYAEWKAQSENKPTVRGQMRDEIDAVISQSKTMIQFFELLGKNGYQIRRRKYTSVKPPYSKRFIRLKSLGEDYAEERINERIIAARHGIWLNPPSVKYRKYRISGRLKCMTKRKLHGFQALYFKYLYLLKKIRKKRTSVKVSAFLRDEIIKFERYKKQFRFLCKNKIETSAQLEKFCEDNEDKITELTAERKRLYKERDKTDEDKKSEIIQRISKNNAELKVNRANVRMCKAIYTDAQRIGEKYMQAKEISAEEIKKEARKNEHKRRSR